MPTDRRLLAREGTHQQRDRENALQGVALRVLPGLHCHLPDGLLRHWPGVPLERRRWTAHCTGAEGTNLRPTVLDVTNQRERRLLPGSDETTRGIRRRGERLDQSLP